MYYVYIIQLRDTSLYIGYSSNLKQRIQSHLNGEAKYTKNHNKMMSLLFYAAFKAKEKAILFEKYLKSSSGFAFRNKHFI
ncbi:MAG: excinuclease ABC subunit C [Microgenomates group bacterium GW2011_GWC1_39_12]|nr:MAG: excinuclease ABC subunit C [Microgenomates group bacterium GW2011_GWC1_39_12]